MDYVTVNTHYAVKSQKQKKAMVKAVRPMTRDEARKLRYGNHVLVLSKNGEWATAKVNGAVKTWKRDPLHVLVHLKYGMYEYFDEEFTAANDVTKLVVEVDTTPLVKGDTNG